MRSRIKYLLERIQSASWLIPAFIGAVLIAFSYMLLSIGEYELPTWLVPQIPSSIEGARLILSSIATATMTVVGVLFSLTIVVLQQVSIQYTPRVVESFIRSTASQFVLGFFVGTFGYCLVLLRMIRQPEEGAQTAVYEIPVTVAGFLALICLGLLIFYLHHLAKAVKSNEILAKLSMRSIETLTAVSRDLKTIDQAVSVVVASDPPLEWEIRANTTGYLQEVRLNQFPKCLGKIRWQGELLVKSGDFVYEHQVLAKFRTHLKIPKKVNRNGSSLFLIGLMRTHSQDPLFGIRQIVDVALRALSPGVNDPTTALEAINELGRVLLSFLTLPPQLDRIHFSNGSELRLATISTSEFLHECFHQILLSGKEFSVVLKQVENVLSIARTRARIPQDRIEIDQIYRQIIYELARPA